MYHEYTETIEKFTDPIAFHEDISSLVDRVRMLHWAMNTISYSEFSIDNDNEWIWKFSNVCFSVIIADTKRAAAMSVEIAISDGKVGNAELAYIRRTEMLRLVEDLQRQELQAQNLSPADIETRVQSIARLICRELDQKESQRHAGGAA